MSESRCSSVTPLDTPIQFGFGIASEVDAHLQRAAHLVANRNASLQALQDAYREAPDQVETLVAMFKILFYQGETEQAEFVVREAMDKAAEQGGFTKEWESLGEESSNWNDPRGFGRLYLYSLKALAFIRLRQDRAQEARGILSAMQRIDPHDQVGADVLRDLLQGVEEESDNG
ncbi:MAG: hypothetical protein ABW068_08340 [Candidatus Thiodiazotropha sp.]